MTSVEKLRAAASRLRLLAGQAGSGQWGCTVHGDYAVFGRNDESGRALDTIGAVYGTDARVVPWIVAMQPAVAAPLAMWLDDTASDFEAERRTEPEASQQEYALAFAEAVLSVAT